MDPTKHTPLDPTRLSPAAQRALSGPMKLMAARGLAPLPDPGDLVSVLYQLALDADANIKAAAEKSLAELPDKVLQGGLSDPSVDPRVLDRLARQVQTKPALVELVILNPSTGDQTIAALAAKLGDRGVDLIAQNEQRLLRHPEIIGAMYQNLRARMSTVDRAVELAVRSEVKVPGIPAWDEVAAAVLGTTRASGADAERDDAVFAAAARSAANPDDAQAEADAEKAPISQMSIPTKIRLATLGNKFQRSMLIRDANKMVALAAIKAPGVNDMEAARYASNHALSDDVITYIANRRDWTKLYGVKVSLVYNPKTPIAAAIRFLSSLRAKDLTMVARSKGIPSAVAAQARKQLMTKGKR